MNIVIDIILALIIIYNLIMGWRKGFVKMILHSLSLIIALVLAYTLVTPVKNIVMDTELGEKTQTTVHSAIMDLLETESNKQEVEAQPDSEQANSDSLLGLLTFTGLDIDEIKGDIEKWKETGAEEIRESIAQRISPPLVDALFTCICFIVLLIIGLIVVSLLTKVLGIVTKLPVIKQADTLLGVGVAVIKAFLEAWIFCSVIQAVLPHSHVLGGILDGFAAEETILYKLFSGVNIFGLLF